MKKKGFTLIELLAVIIILAVIALIATPIVLNIVENARESARKSSVSGYADATRMAIDDYQFASDGNYPSVDKIWADSNAVTKGEKVDCAEVHFSTTFGVVLQKCTVGSNTKEYCYASGKTYEDCEDENYKNIYNSLGNKETGYKDNSGANSPQLVDKLIPVVYEDNEWKVADTNKKWYDYDNKEWANAVILENNITKNVGDSLDIDTEVAQMYVWIPRYEYSIPEYNIGRTDSDIHAIDIKFVNTNKTQANVDAEYNMHPGFKFGDTELSGLWVGKFETTGEDKDNYINYTCTDTNCKEKVTIKPNYATSSGEVAHQFYAARSIESQYNLTNVDTHMAKYTEWTTISYLTNSIYGRCSDATHCTEVTINNNENYYTGNAGESISAEKSSTTNAYNTEKGVLASTTGNITGVYDMSGGALEYVMGILLDSNGNPRSGQYDERNSGFNGSYSYTGMKTDGLAFPDKKYYDTFTSSDASTHKYSVITHVNGKKGDYRGIYKELMNSSNYENDSYWYNDLTYGIYDSLPWFILGGGFDFGASAGVFSSGYGDGGTYGEGFRVILVAEK